MSTPNKQSKPQAAIDMGLLSRIEAASYLGMTYDAFKVIAGRIPAVRLGSRKYYDPKDLMAYLANLQRLCRNKTQFIEN